MCGVVAAQQVLHTALADSVSQGRPAATTNGLRTQSHAGMRAVSGYKNSSDKGPTAGGIAAAHGRCQGWAAPWAVARS